MKITSKTDLKKYFQILENNGLRLDTLYPEDVVFNHKVETMIHESNIYNLQIGVKNIISLLGLDKYDTFQEIQEKITEYFSQFDVNTKLHQCFKEIRLKAKRVEGADLMEMQKKFYRKNDHSYGLYSDLRKSIKFVFSYHPFTQTSNKYYTLYGYETQMALKYIIKHYFDVELPDMTTLLLSDMGVWKDFSNGLMGKMYKNGIFEIKHKDVDVLAKDIKHYVDTNYQQYYIEV